MSDEAARGRCESCGSRIEETFRFCPRCGAGTERARGLSCPACGISHPEEAVFCSRCGAHLSSIAQAERRAITVLFADLSGFTRLTERLDPEIVHTLVASFLEPLTDCVTRWGGYVDKFIGDCVMALFGAPAAHENEPERALRAALDMQDALEAWTESDDFPAEVPEEMRPRLGIGVNTGPVVTGLFSAGGTHDYTAVGDVVNVASRLQSACEGGEILVGEKTYREARHVFEFGEAESLSVRGREEPVRVRRVLGERSERGSVRGFRGRSASLVDRREELEALRAGWADARDGTARILLLVGPAGIGKSRLVEELIAAEELDTVQVASGRSYPYARRTPWKPIAELLWELYDLPTGLEPDRAAVSVARDSSLSWASSETAALSVALGRDAGEVEELAGLAPAERQEAVSGAVTKALSGERAEPRLLVLEDLQWGDRTTLDFVTRMPEEALSGPRLLVLVARPPLSEEEAHGELLERPLDRVEPGPLSADEGRDLLDALLGEHELPERLVERLVDRAEGVPLFLEEMVDSMAEQGAIREEDGVWRPTVDPDTLEVPDGIESLLVTRMDTLPSDTKRVLQYASVVGRRFWSGVLAEKLVGEPVDEDLERLREGTMVRSMPDSRLPGNREFLFDYLLLQEVAYGSLLRGLRADLHGAVAEWLERQPEDQIPDFHDRVGHHWERSNEPEKAVPHLERAARRARDRGALQDARSSLERALDLVEEPDRRASLLGLAENLAADLAETARRAELIDELEALGEETGSKHLAAEAGYRRARLALDSARLEEARRAGTEALEGFRETGDRSRQGHCLSLLGRVAHLRGDYEEARQRYEASLPLQEQADDQRGEAKLRDRLGLVQIDVGRFEEAIETFGAVRSLCREIRALQAEARSISHQASAMRSLGMLEQAEETAREAVKSAESSGSARSLAGSKLTLGRVLGERGKRQEALELLESVAEFAAERSQPTLAARAQLARANLEEGDGAIRWAAEARETAEGAGVVHVTILALTREAEVRLARDDLSTADELSARAHRLLQEQVNIQGPKERVYAVRAGVLEALGREAEASEVRESARAVVRRKAGWIDDPAARERFLERSNVDPAVPAVEASEA